MTGNVRKTLSIIIGAIATGGGIFIAILAKSPSDWLTTTLEWHGFFSGTGTYKVLLIIGGFLFAAYMGRYSQQRTLQVFPQRVKWWNRHIQKVVQKADRLIVIDSYQGHKHEFWDAIEKRLEDERDFDFHYGILRSNDPFFLKILEIIGVDSHICDVELGKIDDLKAKHEKSAHRSKKQLHFFFWEGVSPGPIISWTIRGRERIAHGFWLQVRGMTDLTPYIKLSHGPLFDALKGHYEQVLNRADPID